MKRKLLALLVLVALAVSIVACGDTTGSNSQGTIRDIQSQEGSKDNSGKDGTVENSEAKNDLPEYAKPGQVVSGEKWSIALLYAKEYDSIDTEFYSDKPEDGNKYLALFFDVKNISSENDYFNVLFFDGYVDDYSVSSTLTINNPDGMSIISGGLAPGKMAKGVMVYEVPDDWSSFEISYKDGVWTTHKAATFVINKEDISPADYVYTDSVYEEYVFDNSKKTEIGTEVSGGKWNVKLLDIKKYDVIEDVITTEPDEGKEFLIFFMEAENTSSEDDYFNMLYFRSYVDGYLTDQTTLLSDVDGYSIMSGDVAAGKKIKGYIAVQVPIGWKSAELIYDDGTFAGSGMVEFATVNE